MSNLPAQKEEFNFCPTLRKMEQEIIKSNSSPRILDSHVVEIAKMLKNAIGQSALAIGNKNLDKDDIKMMVKQLTEYFQLRHQDARINEIATAIKLGSFGEFTNEKEVLFITAANIIKWFKRYEVEKMEVLSKQIKYEQDLSDKEIEKQKFMEAKEKYWIDLPENIERCKDLKDVPMASNYFENLWLLGILTLDKEEIKVLREKAKEEVRSLLRSKRQNIVKIGVENLENMNSKRAKEKAFYLWIEENRFNDIKAIVEKAINEKKK